MGPLPFSMHRGGRHPSRRRRNSFRPAASRSDAGAGGAGHYLRALHAEFALYDPKVGYYRRDRTRVGYGPDTDFFTASSSGPIFGELVAAACVRPAGRPSARSSPSSRSGRSRGRRAGVRPGGGRASLRVGAHDLSRENPANWPDPAWSFPTSSSTPSPAAASSSATGVGAEMGGGLGDGAAGRSRAGACRRLPWRRPWRSCWRPPPPRRAAIIDAPLAAVALLEEIAAQPWTGLFVACDYGKTWRELTQETPPRAPCAPTTGTGRRTTCSPAPASRTSLAMSAGTGFRKRPGRSRGFSALARRVPGVVLHPPRRRLHRKRRIAAEAARFSQTKTIPDAAPPPLPYGPEISSAALGSASHPT